MDNNVSLVLLLKLSDPIFLFVLEVCRDGPPFFHNLGRWPDTFQICHCHHPSPGHLISSSDTTSLATTSLALFQSFLRRAARPTSRT